MVGAAEGPRELLASLLSGPPTPVAETAPGREQAVSWTPPVNFLAGHKFPDTAQGPRLPWWCAHGA